MKKNNGKFFIIIGFLLLIAGFMLMPDDRVIGSIGIFFGATNIFKGIQLSRDVQPFVVRKQLERERKIDEELKDEIEMKSKNDNH